jgi:ketosteroid isomerase-like protein
VTTTREQEIFVGALRAWAEGDFEGLMALFHEDVTYIVNVDGMQVPYAMSAVGKNDVRDRLGLLLHTFDVTTFDLENVAHEADHSRALVHGVYKHKATGEILDIRVRFKAWYRDDLIITVEEIQDGRYIEAFERFVYFLQQAAGNQP